MTTLIQLRRGTAAQWAAANPVLANGEMGLETDTSKYKVGDGTSAWNALGYGATNLTGTTANTFEVNSDGTDTNVDLILGRTTGGDAIIRWNGTVVSIDKGVSVTGGFGCNAAAPQTAYASGGELAAYSAGNNGLDSGANMEALHALVVAMRAALVANGIMS